MLKMQRQTPLAIELVVHLACGKWSLYLKFWKTAKGTPDSQHQQERSRQVNICCGRLPSGLGKYFQEQLGFHTNAGSLKKKEERWIPFAGGVQGWTGGMARECKWHKGAWFPLSFCCYFWNSVERMLFFPDPRFEQSPTRNFTFIHPQAKWVPLGRSYTAL